MNGQADPRMMQMLRAMMMSGGQAIGGGQSPMGGIAGGLSQLGNGIGMAMQRRRPQFPQAPGGGRQNPFMGIANFMGMNRNRGLY